MMADSVVNIDEQDRMLIALLQTQARASYHELAQAVGISPSTARRRIERIVNAGGLKLIAVPGWNRLGFNLIAFLGISVELRRLREVGEELSGMDEVTWIAMTAGIYDLFAQIVLPTNEDLTYFITERIATIEGIQDLQAIMVPKFVKTFDEYRLPLKPNPLYQHNGNDGRSTQRGEEEIASDQDIRLTLDPTYMSPARSLVTEEVDRGR